MEDSMYSGSLDSIPYSNLDTDAAIYTELTGSFDLGLLANGDARPSDHKLHQLYPSKNINPFESYTAYGTAKEDPLERPFRKRVADRFEAEYAFCFRWAADRKMRAEKVIPFESNFFSVVRLIFKGRNWVLDCANYDGQYDYCGWLPSLSGSLKQGNQKNDFMITDSSVDLAENREEAGRSTHPSDTNYDVATIPTDYSDVLTKQPIDPIIYKLMGHNDITSQLSKVSQFQSKLFDFPMTDSSPTTAINLSGESRSRIEQTLTTKSSSLDDLFNDLIQLDRMFSRQVEQAEQAEKEGHIMEDFDYLNNTQTAQSFSNIVTSSASRSVTNIPEKEPNARNVLNQLICLTGKKLNFEFLRRIIRFKSN